MPPIFVISLQRSHERRAQISQRLNSLGIPFEIYPAVDGKELDLSHYADRIDDQHIWERGVGLISGEIGCYLSHYQLWQRIVSDNTPHAIILEDDAILPDDFAEIINALPTLGWRWDIVRLSNSVPSKIVRTLCPIGKDRSLVRYQEPGLTTVAYVISLHGANVLCDHCYKIRFAIDVSYNECWKTGLHFWDVHPPAVGQATGEDSILGNEVKDARARQPKKRLSYRIRKSIMKRYNPIIRYLWNILNPPQKR